MPETLAEAYRVQRVSIENWDDDVAGWKVGGVPPSYVERFSETRLAGPIFATSIQRAQSGVVAQLPVFVDGFAAIEPEFIIELGNTRAEDRMFIGAEIASSPIPAINDHGPIAVICDFGNNNGLLVGPEIVDWQSRHEQVAITTVINDETVGAKDLADFSIDSRAALAFLVRHAQHHDILMPPGTLVSTGAITGVHEAAIGARSRLDFGQFGSVELELVAAK